MRPIARAGLVALAVFALHAAIALVTPLPGQFAKYSLAAEQILDGVLSPERRMDFSPLYLWLHVAAERVAPELAPRILEWLQIAFVALAFGGLHLLLAPRFGERLTGFILTFLALERHVLVYERLLEPEPLLLALTVALLVALERSPEAAGRRTAWRIAAGVVAALALATRPTLLPLVALVPIRFWLQLDREAERPRDRWRRLAVDSLAFALPVVLTLGLLAVRAHALTGDARTPLMNPGTVFFEGNNATSHGTSAIYPPLVVQQVRHEGGGATPDVAHEIYRRVARADARAAHDDVGDPEPLTVREVNAYWSGRATAQLRAHPERALSLGLEKLRRAVHGFLWHDVPTAWKYQDRLPLPSPPYALLSALFLVGLLVEARRWRGAFLLYALAASQMAVMVVFYVSARQRLTLLPAVAFFGAAALAAIFRRRDGRALLFERRLVLVPLVLLLTLVAILPDDAMLDELYQRRGHALVDGRLQALRDQVLDGGRLADHQDAVLDALATAPWWLDWMRPAMFPQDDRSIEDRLADRLLAELPTRSLLDADPARFDAAAVLLRAGRLDEAEPLLRDLARRGATVYRGGRQPSHPRVLLARVRAARGDDDEARTLLREVLAETPDEPFALAELAALGGTTPDGASPVERLEAGWSGLDADLLLGAAHLRRNDDSGTNAAVERFGRLIERMPDVQEAHLGLAVALGRLGDDDRAIAQLVEANRIRVEPIHHAAEIATLVERWADRPERTPDDFFLAARLLHQVGRFRPARRLLDRDDWPSSFGPRVEELRRQLREIESPDESPPSS